MGTLEAEGTGDGRTNGQMALFEMEMKLNSIRAKHKCTATKENIGSHGRPNKTRVNGERQGVWMERVIRFMLNS